MISEEVGNLSIAQDKKPRLLHNDMSPLAFNMPGVSAPDPFANFSFPAKPLLDLGAGQEKESADVSQMARAHQRDPSMALGEPQISNSSTAEVNRVVRGHLDQLWDLLDAFDLI